MQRRYTHQALTTHRLNFDRGLAVLIFLLLAMALLLLFAAPGYWRLFAGGIALGLLIAIVIHLRHGSDVDGAGDEMGAEYPHQGITMHRIRFGGGFAGLVFTVGCMLLFLVGTPGLWVVFPAAIVLGALIAIFLHVIHSNRQAPTTIH